MTKKFLVFKTEPQKLYHYLLKLLLQFFCTEKLQLLDCKQSFCNYISPLNKLFVSYMLVQLKMRKNIFKSRLFLFQYLPPKRSSKKIKSFLAYPSAKSTMTISKVLKCNLLFFLKSSFLTEAGCIALTWLLESIKAN